MACFKSTIGHFNAVSWVSDAPEITVHNGVKVNFTRSGGTITGINVFTPSHSINVTAAQAKYFSWGESLQYLAIFTVSGPSGGNTFRVISLIDLDDPMLSSRQIVTADLPNSQSLPFMKISRGGGGVVYAGTVRSELNHLKIGLYTAIGTPLASNSNYLLPGPISLLDAIAITKTHFEVRFNYESEEQPGTLVLAADIAGKVRFTDGLNNSVISQLQFPSVTVGDTVTKNFAVLNLGDNCVTISSITAEPPFSIVQNTANRVLQPNGELELTVRFTPTDNLSYSKYIEIHGLAPEELMSGTAKLRCKGNGTDPSISIIGNLQFGKVPVNTSKTKSFRIKNTSSTHNVSYSGAASSIGLPFRWNSFSGTLAPGAESADITVTFLSPPITQTFPHFPVQFEQQHQATLIIMTSPQTGMHNIPLNAISCNPQPQISVDRIITDFGLSFGDVKMGTKKIISIEVLNPGNAPLHYSARIVPSRPGNFHSEMEASGFGLQLTDNINSTPVRLLPDLHANPVSPCGALDSGNGKSVVFITVKGFTMGEHHAILEIFNHNVQNVSAFSSIRIVLRANVPAIFHSN